MATEFLLDVRELSCGYSSDVDVLRGVSLQVRSGSIVGLIGLNGAGKSTLMKAIFNFLPAKSGHILLDGRPLAPVPPHRMLDHGVWMIPQESSLFPYLSVQENLYLVAGRLRLPAAERLRRLQEALDAFPVLRERLRDKAGSLSGGQQKALEFARAILVRPRLCLVDEPTVGLAPKVAQEVYRWTRQLASQFGAAVLLVDHNIPLVLELADYVYVLNLGQIKAAGPSRELRRDLHGQLRSWLGLEA